MTSNHHHPVTPFPPTVDIRAAFARDAASVWVVTAAESEVPTGFTAISVRSVSVAPPIISFNIGKLTSSRGIIERTGRIAAHLLSADQEHVARTFAGPREERFRGRHWGWHADGLPAVASPLVRVSGDVLSLTDAGDSLVVLTELHDIEHGVGEPLLHHARGYRSLEVAPSGLLVGTQA